MDFSRIDDKGYVEQKINEALNHIGDFEFIKLSIELTLENIENNKDGTTNDEKRLLKQNRSTFKLDIGQKVFFEREKPKYENLLGYIEEKHSDWNEEIGYIKIVLKMFSKIIKYLENKENEYETNYATKSTSKMGSRSTSKRGAKYGGSIIRRLPIKPKAKPDKPKAKPKAKPIKPKAKPIKPKAKPVKPKAKPVKPKAKPVKPKAKPVKPVKPKAK